MKLSFLKMASNTKTLLKYDSADKLRFKAFFLRPKKKKGRPKKRKRGRPKAVQNNEKKKAKQNMIAG